MQDRPVALLGAAAALAVEAAGVFIASVLSARDTAAGQSYQLSSGIALTVIGFATAVALAVVALGVLRVRPWSRTPALMIQLFTVIAGIILLQGHRMEWGAPAVVLALGAATALLVPPSLHALSRPLPPPAASPPSSKAQKSPKARKPGVPPAPRAPKAPQAAKAPRAPKAPRR